MIEVVSNGIDLVIALCPWVTYSIHAILVITFSNIAFLVLKMNVGNYPVTIDTIDFIVRTVGEVGRVELVFTLDAEEALLVVRATLGNLLLSLEHHSMAPFKIHSSQFSFLIKQWGLFLGGGLPWANICFSILSLN